jgi:hypothetical protein
VVFVVISVLVGALVYSSISAFNVFAVQRGEAPPDADCEGDVISDTAVCCWTEADPDPERGIELNWCQSCSTNGCNNKFPAPLELEQPPTPTPGPAAPLQDGGVLQQPPTQGVAPPVTRGQGVSPQDGALQQPPADQGATELPPPATEETQPATEQSVPVCQEGLEFNEDLGFCVPENCPEGQILDEETGLCVLEEQEAVEEPEQQPTEEEQQPSEENGSEDNN